MKTIKKSDIIAMGLGCIFGIGLGRLSVQNQSYFPKETKIKNAYFMTDPNNPNKHYSLIQTDSGQESILIIDDGINYKNIEEIIEEQNTKLIKEIKKKIKEDIMKNYTNN